MHQTPQRSRQGSQERAIGRQHPDCLQTVGALKELLEKEKGGGGGYMSHEEEDTYPVQTVGALKELWEKETHACIRTHVSSSSYDMHVSSSS